VSKRVAIIGAGLSGLTAAWKLRAAGCDVQVLEKTDRVGGRTMSLHRDDFIFDIGAITMLPTYVNAVALAEELGISAHLHRVIPVIGIPRDGKIHRLDLGKPLASLLGTKLISTWAKIRLLKLVPSLLRAWRRARFDSFAPLADEDTETVGVRVRRLCGGDVAEYVAGPIIRGNTLNSIETATYAEFLWMLRQYAAPHLFGFDQGINFLAETLGSNLPVALGAEVTRVERHEDGVTLHGRRNGSFTDRFDACVIALPPKAVLALAPVLTPRQRSFLETLRPLKSLSLHVGLSSTPPMTETFILPPASESPMLTTIVMDHLKAPGRAPPGKAVLSFFMSDDWYDTNVDRADQDLKTDILAMATPFVGDLSGDVEAYYVSRWPYAVIKSEVGLYKRIRDYEADVDENDHVQFGGDYLAQGMEAAVIGGAKMADRLIRKFQQETGLA
jgi:oxygen-dependent protoporphyrinogen oxidase